MRRPDALRRGNTVSLLETICYALAKLQELPESAVLDRVRELKAVMQMDSYLVDGLLDRKSVGKGAVPRVNHDGGEKGAGATDEDDKYARTVIDLNRYVSDGANDTRR